MKIYEWYSGRYCLGGTFIVVADCIESAKEIILKELNFDDDWDDYPDWDGWEGIYEVESNDCVIVHCPMCYDSQI